MRKKTHHAGSNTTHRNKSAAALATRGARINSNRSKRKPTRRPAGRPTEYGPHILEAAEHYLTHFADHGHAIPSIAGLADVLGLSRETLYLWQRDDERVEFIDMMGRLLTKQEVVLLTNGLLKVFDPTLSRRVLAKHGYHEVVESQLSGPRGGPIQSQTAKIVPTMDPVEASRLYREFLRPLG